MLDKTNPSNGNESKYPTLFDLCKIENSDLEEVKNMKECYYKSINGTDTDIALAIKAQLNSELVYYDKMFYLWNSTTLLWENICEELITSKVFDTLEEQYKQMLIRLDPESIDWELVNKVSIKIKFTAKRMAVLKSLKCYIYGASIY